MSAHRATTTGKTSAADITTLAVDKPSGLSAGDWISGGVFVVNTTTQNSWSDLSLPTDAFLLADVNGGSSSYAKLFLVGKIADGSEGSTLSFSYTAPGGSSDTFLIMAILNARSGHDAVPFDHTVVEANTATGGSTTTLVRTGAGWTTNVHAGKILRNITTGKFAYIASNTSDTLTLRHAMSSANANTHSYSILSQAAAASFKSSGADTTVVAPAVTKTATAGQLVAFFAGGDGNESSFEDNITLPGGMTERAEVEIDSRGGWARMAAGDEAYTTTGSTGTRTANSGFTNWKSFGAMIALREPGTAITGSGAPASSSTTLAGFGGITSPVLKPFISPVTSVRCSPTSVSGSGTLG